VDQTFSVAVQAASDKRLIVKLPSELYLKDNTTFYLRQALSSKDPVHFSNGKAFLQRYIQSNPTSAIFMEYSTTEYRKSLTRHTQFNAMDSMQIMSTIQRQISQGQDMVPMGDGYLETGETWMNIIDDPNHVIDNDSALVDHFKAFPTFAVGYSRMDKTVPASIQAAFMSMNLTDTRLHLPLWHWICRSEEFHAAMITGNPLNIGYLVSATHHAIKAIKTDSSLYSASPDEVGKRIQYHMQVLNVVDINDNRQTMFNIHTLRTNETMALIDYSNQLFSEMIRSGRYEETELSELTKLANQTSVAVALKCEFLHNTSQKRAFVQQIEALFVKENNVHGNEYLKDILKTLGDPQATVFKAPDDIFVIALNAFTGPHAVYKENRQYWHLFRSDVFEAEIRAYFALMDREKGHFAQLDKVYRVEDDAQRQAQRDYIKVHDLTEIIKADVGAIVNDNTMNLDAKLHALQRYVIPVTSKSHINSTLAQLTQLIEPLPKSNDKRFILDQWTDQINALQNINQPVLQYALAELNSLSKPLQGYVPGGLAIRKIVQCAKTIRMHLQRNYLSDAEIVDLHIDGIVDALDKIDNSYLNDYPTDQDRLHQEVKFFAEAELKKYGQFPALMQTMDSTITDMIHKISTDDVNVIGQGMRAVRDAYDNSKDSALTEYQQKQLDLKMNDATSIIMQYTLKSSQKDLGDLPTKFAQFDDMNNRFNQEFSAFQGAMKEFLRIDENKDRDERFSNFDSNGVKYIKALQQSLEVNYENLRQQGKEMNVLLKDLDTHFLQCSNQNGRNNSLYLHYCETLKTNSQNYKAYEFKELEPMNRFLSDDLSSESPIHLDSKLLLPLRDFEHVKDWYAITEEDKGKLLELRTELYSVLSGSNGIMQQLKSAETTSNVPEFRRNAIYRSIAICQILIEGRSNGIVFGPSLTTDLMSDNERLFNKNITNTVPVNSLYGLGMYLLNQNDDFRVAIVKTEDITNKHPMPIAPKPLNFDSAVISFDSVESLMNMTSQVMINTDPNFNITQAIGGSNNLMFGPSRIVAAQRDISRLNNQTDFMSNMLGNAPDGIVNDMTAILRRVHRDAAMEQGGMRVTPGVGIGLMGILHNTVMRIVVKTSAMGRSSETNEAISQAVLNVMSPNQKLSISDSFTGMVASHPTEFMLAAMGLFALTVMAAPVVRKVTRDRGSSALKTMDSTLNWLQQRVQKDRFFAPNLLLGLSAVPFSIQFLHAFMHFQSISTGQWGSMLGSLRGAYATVFSNYVDIAQTNLAPYGIGGSVFNAVKAYTTFLEGRKLSELVGILDAMRGEGLINKQYNSWEEWQNVTMGGGNNTSILEQLGYDPRNIQLELLQPYPWMTMGIFAAFSVLSMYSTYALVQEERKQLEAVIQARRDYGDAHLYRYKPSIKENITWKDRYLTLLDFCESRPFWKWMKGELHPILKGARSARYTNSLIDYDVFPDYKDIENTDVLPWKADPTDNIYRYNTRSKTASGDVVVRGLFGRTGDLINAFGEILFNDEIKSLTTLMNELDFSVSGKIPPIDPLQLLVCNLLVFHHPDPIKVQPIPKDAPEKMIMTLHQQSPRPKKDYKEPERNAADRGNFKKLLRILETLFFIPKELSASAIEFPFGIRFLILQLIPGFRFVYNNDPNNRFKSNSSLSPLHGLFTCFAEEQPIYWIPMDENLLGSSNDEKLFFQNAQEKAYYCTCIGYIKENAPSGYTSRLRTYIEHCTLLIYYVLRGNLDSNALINKVMNELNKLVGILKEICDGSFPLLASAEDKATRQTIVNEAMGFLDACKLYLEILNVMWKENSGFYIENMRLVDNIPIELTKKQHVMVEGTSVEITTAQKPLTDLERLAQFNNHISLFGFSRRPENVESAWLSNEISLIHDYMESLMIGNRQNLEREAVSYNDKVRFYAFYDLARGYRQRYRQVWKLNADVLNKIPKQMLLCILQFAHQPKWLTFYLDSNDIAKVSTAFYKDEHDIFTVAHDILQGARVSQVPFANVEVRKVTGAENAVQAFTAHVAEANKS
jgi:hypothetical protein